MKREELARKIDLTVLKPEATVSDITALCQEAVRYGTASVCVNPVHVRLCARLLEGSGVKVCTVIGFPLGANTPETKAFETEQAIRDGAVEIDMVVNVGALKGGDHERVKQDIRYVVMAAAGKQASLPESSRRPPKPGRSAIEEATAIAANELRILLASIAKKESAATVSGALVKVIIETCLLTADEEKEACRLAVEAGAEYVKTSTGFSKSGATVADVGLMREAIAGKAKIKAAGGIRTLADALAMIEAGADRLGIGLEGAIKILEECPE